MYDSIRLLESVLEDLPAEHHEKPGLIRAIEVLKDEHRSRQRRRVPVRPSAAGSRAEGKAGPKTSKDLFTMLVDLEHGIEQARGLDPAWDTGWPMQIMDLRRSVKTLDTALRDETFPIEDVWRQTLRRKLDAAAQTILREFFGLTDEQAEALIHGQGLGGADVRPGAD